MGTVDKEVYECIVTESQVATIKPYEERGLWAPGVYPWQVLPAIILYEADIRCSLQ